MSRVNIDCIISEIPDETSDRNYWAEFRNKKKVGEKYWVYLPQDHSYAETTIQNIEYLSGKPVYHCFCEVRNLHVSTLYLYTSNEVQYMLAEHWD